MSSRAKRGICTRRSSRAKRGICSLLLVVAPHLLTSQERGAIALGEAVLGLGVNARVLMIGAHPDDEDTDLIAWLSRGRHVKTAYLSLTRGDGGQNLIGSELGEALGVIRTEELLAARRIDGGDQYFTRAFDFGYSKDTLDTYAHWPKDSILGDVVRIVRAFRPHVIIAVWSGTPRDGHGHHQVSGLLAREGYDVSADTIRFPVTTHGAPWTASKFYRTARPGPFGGGTTVTAGTVPSAPAGAIGVNVGEYSPLLGRSFAEIAGESRSQHKSQGFGALQRKGPVMDYVRREATRVNDATSSGSETSMFNGMDTSWARFRPRLAAIRPRGSEDSATRARALKALDDLPRAVARVRAAYDPFAPQNVVAPLKSLTEQAASIYAFLCGSPIDPRRCIETRWQMRGRTFVGRAAVDGDISASLRELQYRAAQAARLATGISVEAVVSRELQPLSGDVRVVASLYNRGNDTISVSEGWVRYDRGGVTETRPPRTVLPGGVVRDTLTARFDSVAQPAWLKRGRAGALFLEPASALAENAFDVMPQVYYMVTFSDEDAMGFHAPIVFRYADDIRGEVQVAAAGAPPISVTLGQQVAYAPANTTLDRPVDVRVVSADDRSRTVRVSLVLPSGLAADTAASVIQLERYAARTVTFRIRGQLQAGDHRLAAVAESDGQTFTTGYQLIDYEHIRRQRIYRPAEARIAAVDVRVPGNLSVGYIAGVGDNVAPALAQLGIPVTIIQPAAIARAPLSGFTTLVIGPRAYEAHADLVAANQRILDFARRGGTVVTQYGQYEMTQPGILPYPIMINRPHDRVALEGSPVTILDPKARELTAPNRITDADFAGWVQERALYMPRTFDPQWRPLLAMNDAGMEPNRGAILVAPVGEGRYIYTTAAFFRQLPAGVPGGARLFVNLLSAGLQQTRTTP